MARSKAEPQVPTPGSDQLREILANLARGGTSKYFIEIRRRCKPATGGLWQRWKYNIPADEIDDVQQYCYEEGGDFYEYKIWVRDSDGQPARGPDGHTVGPFYLPSLVGPDEAKKKYLQQRQSTQDDDVVSSDPDLAERIKELRRKKQEMEIERQEAALERERVRLEKMKSKILSGEEEDEDEEDPSYRYGSPYYRNPWGGTNGPWQQMPPYGRSSDAVELAKAFAPVLTALLQKNDGISTKDIIALFLGEGRSKGFDPKDLVGFISPLLNEMSRTMGEVNKVAMERMADSDQFWKEKLLEAARLGGAGDDEIDKWRKVLGLATDTVREGAKILFGRPSIMTNKVEVPVLRQQQSPPQGIQDKSISSLGSPPPSDPAEEARKVASQRIVMFLSSHEQELLIGSDPSVIADKLYELYAMLPIDLRRRIEQSDVAAIYEALNERCPEIVSRILQAVKDDTTGARKAWCEEFWRVIKTPPEEEVEDDGKGEEGVDDEVGSGDER